MGTVRIRSMFEQILIELDVARNSLSEAAAWARSDWSDDRALTGDEAEARSAVFDTVRQAKDAIDHTKGLIFQAQRSRVHQGSR